MTWWSFLAPLPDQWWQLIFWLWAYQLFLQSFWLQWKLCPCNHCCCICHEHCAHCAHGTITCIAAMMMTITDIVASIRIALFVVILWTMLMCAANLSVGMSLIFLPFTFDFCFSSLSVLLMCSVLWYYSKKQMSVVTSIRSALCISLFFCQCHNGMETKSVQFFLVSGQSHHVMEQTILKVHS